MAGAPNAKIEKTDSVKPFIGKNILRLQAGEEIVSSYICLPVANRSYYAMCGVLSNEMRVTVAVEDEYGKSVNCNFQSGGTLIETCPQTGAPSLGGGFVFAHMYNKPAGRYRIRVRAETDCLIDEVDIRPSLDVGISIIENTYPTAHFTGILENKKCAFFDYTKFGSPGSPGYDRAKVSGNGTITIKNGTIKNEFEGIRSWCIQSTAPNVQLVLSNIKCISAGINTNAVSHYGKAKIQYCRFEINTPFIINRHLLADSPVSVEGDNSEVSNCIFIGGQGCLNINGSNSEIHDNIFVNKQTVTNHYSLMLGGNAEGIKIFRNNFIPEIGSGILMFQVRNCDVHENIFKISTANGNCEYTNEDYSTNAIRITDYGSVLGSPNGAYGNKIYNNHFEITGLHYTTYNGFIGVASALFISVGGGTNKVFDNDIQVVNKSVDSSSIACAFYLGGSQQAGIFDNNRITTNVPAFWCGTFYGHTLNAIISNNTIINSNSTPGNFKPFHFGYGDYKATNIEFKNNKFVNCEFGVLQENSGHFFQRK